MDSTRAWKYPLAVTLTAILVVGFIASPAFAASPHFYKTPTIVDNPNDSLTATFKAAGLGKLVTNVFLTSSGGVAYLACVDSGGAVSELLAFEPIQGLVTTVQPRNGNVAATVTIGPPPLPSASQVCADPSDTIEVIKITYDNVVLHIQQNSFDILTYNFGSVET